MSAFSHLNADHLLEDSCSFYSFTARTQDSDTLERTNTYAAAVTTACLMTVPSRRWQTQFPVAALENTCEVWLPEDTAVKPQDKITYNAEDYRVMAVADWQGFKSALLRRIEGVS